MSVTALEGIVEKGRIRLCSDMRLPENTKVFVVVPGFQAEPRPRVVSPRLVNPEEIADFILEVVEEEGNDDL